MWANLATMALQLYVSISTKISIVVMEIINLPHSKTSHVAFFSLSCCHVTRRVSNINIKFPIINIKILAKTYFSITLS